VGPRKINPNIHVRVKPELHTHIECELRFLPLLHTSDIRECCSAPSSEMLFQGVVSIKEDGENSGLCPVKGQKSGPSSWIGRNKFSSLSLNTDKTLLSEFPVMEPSLQVPLTELPYRDTLRLPGTLSPFLQVLGKRILLQVPQWCPYGESCLLPEPPFFFTYLSDFPTYKVSW
jgi:hypothetical protein